MRWHFIDPTNETELAYKRQKEAAISTFWKSFEEDAERLFEAGQSRNLEPIVSWVEHHLPKVEHLMWDVSIDKPKSSFVITPETRHDLRPLAEEMVRVAPKLSNWRFGNFREPHAVKIVDVDDSRVKGDFKDLRFVAHKKDFNAIELVFLSSQFKRDHDDSDQYACFVICELLLGEELLEKWVGDISTRCLQRPLQEKIINLFGRTKHDPAEGSLPVDELLQTVVSLRNQIHRELPSAPYHKGKFEEFSGIFLHAKDGTLPSRFTFNIALPNVISAINNRFLFHSEQFSKHGEKFCYLKINDMEKIRTSVEARGMLEDLVDAALRAEDVGCVFGGGAGQESAFIDLILQDVERAVPILRELAKKEGLSDRSWLLFHDISWSGEWVGLLPSSPLPERDGNEW